MTASPSLSGRGPFHHVGSQVARLPSVTAYGEATELPCPQEAGHAAQFWHVPQLLQRVGPLWATKPSLVGAAPAEVASRTFHFEVCRLRPADHTDQPWHGYGLLPRLAHGRSAGFGPMGRGQARTPKLRDCIVCHKPTIQVWLGMDRNCDKSWCTAGRPDRDKWAPTRRAWLDFAGRGFSWRRDRSSPGTRCWSRAGTRSAETSSGAESRRNDRADRRQFLVYPEWHCSLQPPLALSPRAPLAG